MKSNPFLNFLLPHIFRDQELLLKYVQYSVPHLKISMNIYILYFDNLEDGCFNFICFLLYKTIFLHSGCGNKKKPELPSYNKTMQTLESKSFSMCVHA